MGDTLKICIAGAGGRMGQALAEAVEGHTGLQLVAALDHPEAPGVGKPVRPGAAVSVSADVEAAVGTADVLVDFTRPEASMTLLKACRARGCGMVIGTTGFTNDQLAEIETASAEIPIVMAANYSLGVTLLRALVTQAAKALGEDFDIEVVEAHHRHKVDAPSGTALALGEAAAEARGAKLADVAVTSREGHTGERAAGAIGFATVRGGDVVGDHQVLFLGDGERIELGHRATSRATFALGALRAAAWLRGRSPGRYDLFDVLGL
jgi:4-hydroxy-tetrahydrodipicolinate reductase